MMIRKRYGLLIVLSLVAMLGVAAGAGLYYVYAPLPDPSQATTEQLFRWLVTRDLSQEPASVQQAIIHRLDSDLGQTSDLTEVIAQLNESRRTMLWNNIGTLLSPWLLEKVDEYAKLPAAEQPAYLDRFLDRVDQWSKIGAACQQGSSATISKSDAKSDAKPAGSHSKLIADRIAECSRHAEPAQKTRIAGFMTAVQGRWIVRQFSTFGLFGKPARP
jgi:hypothetical protein